MLHVQDRAVIPKLRGEGKWSWVQHSSELCRFGSKCKGGVLEEQRGGRVVLCISQRTNLPTAGDCEDGLNATCRVDAVVGADSRDASVIIGSCRTILLARVRAMRPFFYLFILSF